MPATNIEKTTTLPRIGGDVPRVMTAEEYVTFSDQQNGYTCELVRGVLVVRDPGVSWTHSYVQGKLYRYLDEWMEKFGCGEVGVEIDCLLGEDPDTVRIPDVGVLLQPFDTENAFLGRVRGAPDIVIEVLSPSNSPQEMRDKTSDYFNAGALRVWIVDPEARTIIIHKADGTNTRFGGKDRLEDPEILPGFTLEMQKVFEA